MRFVDEAKIEVIAGNGGGGIASLCREKYRPKGGPDGGDGGVGGAVYAVADKGVTTLIDYRYKRIHSAQNGESGRGSQCHGKNGKDLIISVPLGTIITDLETQEVIADMALPGVKYLLAKGGDGGLGNMHFKSSTNQVPRQKTSGAQGQRRSLKLELKVLADVGLLGMPNAGKSTLINVLSNARPRIADYPFTTTQPHLGLVDVEPGKSFVMADVPGLIAGAAQGIGLGHQFLRHLQRAKLLLHIIDISDNDETDIDTRAQEAAAIVKELAHFDDALYQKPRWLVFNKIDACLEVEQTVAQWKQALAKYNVLPDTTFVISAFDNTNTKSLCYAIFSHLESQVIAEPLCANSVEDSLDMRNDPRFRTV